jgi:hypothetical protein
MRDDTASWPSITTPATCNPDADGLPRARSCSSKPTRGRRRPTAATCLAPSPAHFYNSRRTCSSTSIRSFPHGGRLAEVRGRSKRTAPPNVVRQESRRGKRMGRKCGERGSVGCGHGVRSSADLRHQLDDARGHASRSVVTALATYMVTQFRTSRRCRGVSVARVGAALRRDVIG